MPREKAKRGNGANGGAAPVRSFWSGTLTFGLVSIPVDVFSAVRPRDTSMRLVDKNGHPLGRRYHCSRDGKRLPADEIVRGYETQSGETVVITDEELESVAPEMSREIELRQFVPREQISPVYCDRPYFLAPAGRSSKAYHLLAKTLERTGRAGIGTFVMRGHEYLAAILPEDGVLRAQTLRRQAELRTPRDVGLPDRAKPDAKLVKRFLTHIGALRRDELDITELEDREAASLQKLAQEQEAKTEGVIHMKAADEESETGGAQIIDLMDVLRKSLSRSAQVRTPASGRGNGSSATAGARRATRRKASTSHRKLPQK